MGSPNDYLSGVGPIVAVLYLLLRNQATAARSTGATSSSPKPRFDRWSTVGWWGAMAVAVAVAWLDLVAPLLGPTPAMPTAGAMLRGTAFAASALWLVVAWHALERLSPHLPPRVVYWLARMSLVCPHTGEARAGAVLLGGIALAHRPSSTRASRAWLRKRLEQEHRYRGTAASAQALLAALDAASARRAGDRARADRLDADADALLGTVAYLSPSAVPATVRAWAEELLGLRAARRGQWGMFLAPPLTTSPRPLTRLLRAWVSDGRRATAAASSWEALRPKVRSPILDGLFARVPPAALSVDVSGLHALASQAVAALVRGVWVAPGHLLVMLRAYDELLSPETEGSLVPPELAGDDAEVARLHDEAARALARILSGKEIPLFLLHGVMGPVSARVYTLLENELLAELEAALSAAGEKAALVARAPAKVEWLVVSRIRATYRRAQRTFGDAVNASMWPAVLVKYGKFGVMLSETAPRRRALAHAVFACLHKEATDLGDVLNQRIQARNLTVTAGLD